jgi:hypothetical protein
MHEDVAGASPVQEGGRSFERPYDRLDSARCEPVGATGISGRAPYFMPVGAERPRDRASYVSGRADNEDLHGSRRFYRDPGAAATW